MTEHEPCPFCSETEKLEVVIHACRPGVEQGWVECQNCGAQGQTQYGSCEPQEMINLVWYGWDERA